ncbi:hypothetical protein F5Y17DRAFT_451273 [Xylariaceae sp. FL0594]|nr:hypothetical protein F5Y17DRAFT_451273 [Xylariaceae sp. FL0594]
MFITRNLVINRQPLLGRMASKHGKYGNANPAGAAGNPKRISSNLRTVTALSRWSILSDPLPPVDSIGVIHVYDFDNTLFQTPLPNPKLWNGATLGRLGSPDIFVNGGWWHDSRILAATGEGVEREEPRAWEGWWNEKIVELVRLSMQQKDALCVLLTGRGESGFSDLIKRIVKSKGLQFDLIGLKPQVGPNNERFKNTMAFKQAFLRAVMETYKKAQEIRIYEDRPKHTIGFREFLAEYNGYLRNYRGQPSRGPIAAEVIQVADISTNLDPVVEIAEVQHLINNHNAIVGAKTKRARGERLMIKKTVYFTGYMIKAEDTKRLIALLAPQLPEGEVRYQANIVMITPRACPGPILEKIGGIRAKMQWAVAGTGSWDNSIWAVSLKPVPASAQYHTDSDVPSVVIATRRTARPADVHRIQNWQPIPPEKAFIFETEVGEKLMLKIEAENAPDEESEGLSSSLTGGAAAAPQNQKGKRKFTYSKGDGKDEQQQQRGPIGAARGFHGTGYMGRGSGGGRGGGGGGFKGGPPSRGHRGGAARGRGGGRGGRGGYRSLDDLGSREGPGGVSYDDNFPALGGGGGGGGSYHQSSSQSAPGPPSSHFSHHQSGSGNSWQPSTGPAGGGGGFGGQDLQKFY